MIYKKALTIAIVAITITTAWFFRDTIEPKKKLIDMSKYETRYVTLAEIEWYEDNWRRYPNE